MENDFIESLLYQLVDEETLGVCFELHRAIKLDYYDLIHPDKSSFEKHDVVDEAGLDVFGNSVQSFRKPVECVCPSCQRTLGASKFAPHLEKCLGMGRTSSRLAHKKPQVNNSVESEGEHSEDNEEDWTYPEKKSKKLKREKSLQFPTIPPSMMTASSGRTKLSSVKSTGRDGYQSGNGSTASDSLYNTRPSVQQHNAASFSALPTDYKHHLLQQICGVISERTGRLCTRTIKCPQHSEEDRLAIRHMLLEQNEPVDVGSGSGGILHHSSSSLDHQSTKSLGHLDDTNSKDKYINDESHRHFRKKREGNSKKHKRTAHPPTYG